MDSSMRRTLAPVLAAWALLLALPLRGETFRVAEYNVESYLSSAYGTRKAKSPESRAKVRESIRALKPDVLALEEIGEPEALKELQVSLKSEGLDLPHSEFVEGFDTNIHVAVLSRFPFSRRRPHTNENFLLNGRRFQVSRGFAELDVQVSSNYSFTLLAAHLKSKRTSGMADESELRLEEARRLREIIDARLAADPNTNLVVLGDFNDTRDSPAVKAVLGKGRSKLLDTRPAERNGDDGALFTAGRDARVVAWTHYYPKEDSYSRIDYLLLSPGMERAWAPRETYVLTLKNWGAGSDHRPIVAAFEAGSGD
jgi:endonuclease/exonuclease/phosphatase family metal-dependent hydrolase